ncbi:MAG: GNAT family N-acetyltransferase [candidate division WOR-3 bacterium]|nr:GNAT family N-acetyltransferase [candidate division WOR-3 bacterium]
MRKPKRGDNVVIRRGRVTDDVALAKLLCELGYHSSPNFARKKIRQLSGTETDRVFVAVAEKVVTGFASCHIMPLIHQPGCLCRVTALCVSTERRAAGIGRLLMEAVEDFARSTDCLRIEITSGKHRNHAHEFYRRIGYREVSSRFLKVL